MDFNKYPRWALVGLAGFLFFICLNFTNRAIAEGDKVKVVAYQAKNNADNAISISQDLKAQIADIRDSQEVFRREYREDQKDLSKSLDEQKTLLLKISSKL